nr:uncharacterized protein LOC118079504 isoform X2 [Zootoca vivipara]
MVKSKKKKNQQNNGYCQDYRWGPGGNMPPWMGGPCPDDKWGPGGDMPPWMGGPYPDDKWGPGGDMPPWMGGPCPDDKWGPGGDMPPWMGGPCPDDMRGPGRNMPPWMRDPCLDDTGGPGGDMPPWAGGPCPDDMRGPGRYMPPWMRDPCLDDTGGPGGDMPPWAEGPCPDDTGGPGGNMPPWMRDPCPDDMWQPRKRRKYMQPNMRGPCPNMGDPRENMYSGPNAPDQRQCRTFGGPGKSLSGKEQPMENGRDNGPLPPGNCSSDQPASLNLFDKNNFKKRKDQPTSRNAAESASNTQKHYRMLTEEGAARILSNFGLSTEDLVEFGHYSDDQLKPENMAMILRDIVERKKARQLPTSSQGKEEETSSRHGGSDSLMKRPVVPSAAQPTTTPAASFMPQSSVSPSPSMMKDYHAVSPTVLPHVCSLCKIECANTTDWNLHVGTTAHSKKCAQLRQQYPDWNPEDCSLLQRHEGDKKEKHIAMPCSTSSNSNASQHSVPGHASSQTQSHSVPGHASSQTQSQSRSSRSSERPSSPSLSSQSSSIQRRELGISTRSPASSAEAGSSRQPPAKPDVAEQPPNKSEHPLQTNPGHQKLPKKEAATQKQGDQQPPAKSDVTEQPPNKSEHPLQTNPGHQELPMKEAATQEQGDRQPAVKSDVAEQPPNKSEHPLQTNPGHQEVPKKEAATQEQGDRQPAVKSDVGEQPPNKSEHPLQTNPGHQEVPKKEAATQEQGDRQPPAKSNVAEQPPNKSEHPLQTNPDHQKLPKKEAVTQKQGDRQPPAKSGVTEQPPNKSEHPLQTNPGHQELPKKEAATLEQGDRQPEDLLRLALTPLAEQTVMQALSVLQSGGAVGAGLTQGTSLPPLPPVQIDPASLVSMMQLVATQVVQAALASKEASSVQGSPSVAGSPQLSIPAESEEKKQESSQEVVPGVAPSSAACVERSEASGSKGGLTPSTLFTVPWPQKKDARRPKKNLPAEIPADGWDGGKPVRVVIAGQSVVFQARRRAVQSSLGLNLGLSPMAFIRWFIRKDLLCGQVLSAYLNKVVQQKPDMMVLHIDGNEIGVVDTEVIVSQMVADLKAIRQSCPGIVILWSNIFPRRAWSASPPMMKVFTKMRKTFNSEMKFALFPTEDRTISHPQINSSSWQLYGQDGSSLSAVGNDIFLSNLRTEIKAHILRRWGKKH